MIEQVAEVEHAVVALRDIATGGNRPAGRGPRGEDAVPPPTRKR